MTAPPATSHHSTGRRRLIAVAKYAALGVVLLWCVRYLAAHWAEAQHALATTSPRWTLLAASAVVVLGAHAVLIQVWRSILAGAGERLAYLPAARIWTVSNLGKYVPGKVWQMSAMALMAREQGVSGVAAAGSSVLSVLVTLVTGFAVTVMTGAGVLPDRRAALVAALATIAALVVMPVGLPLGERLVRRATGREVTFPRLAPRAFVVAVVGSSLGWLLLGSGFHLLGRGLGVVDISLPASVAAFVGSYLAGFLALFAPGGVGAREGVMQGMLHGLGVPDGEALVLVVASRLWLTVLEILPALVFIAAGALRRQDTQRPAGASTGDA
jgi:glycosyltransferase 2 family protein